MKQKSFLLTLSIIFSMSTALFSQQAFVEELVKNINNKQTEKVKAVCAAGFWDNKAGDSAGHFYKQVSHPKYGMELQMNQALKIEKDRAVATIDLYSAQKNRIVDQGFFYLEKKNGIWIWGGIDETKEHVNAFLQGKVPASFAIRSYPPLSALNDWGNLFITEFNKGQTLDDKVKLVKGLMSYKEEITGSVLYQLSDYPQLTYKKNYWVESLNRGVVIVEGTNPEYPDYPDEISIYLEKKGDGWLFLRTTSYPSSGSILEDY